MIYFKIYHKKLMKIKKYFKFVMFILILLTILLAMILKTESHAVSSEFSYKINSDNTITITGYRGSSSQVRIPSEIDNCKVKNIDMKVFQNNTSIRKVVIEEGITSIGDYAFCNATNLESVKLPNSLVDFGAFSFMGCKNLSEITIPSAVTEIKMYAFQETAIKEIIIPENVENIGDYAFRSCKNLEKFIVYSRKVQYGSPMISGGYTGSDIFDNCEKNKITVYAYPFTPTGSYTVMYGLKFKDVSVLNIEPEAIGLNVTELSLEIGQTKEISVTVQPENSTNKTVIWSSSNENVATVNNGSIKAVGEGTATISAFTYDKKFEAKCIVTVTEHKDDDPIGDDGDDKKDDENDKDDDTIKDDKNDKDDDTIKDDKNDEENKDDVNDNEVKDDENKNDSTDNKTDEENKKLDDKTENSQKTNEVNNTYSTGKKEDNTVANMILPNTGKKIVVMLLIASIVVTGILYKVNKYYNKI